MIARLKAILSDSLLRNSLYFMVSTLLMAATGFFFWLLSARFAPSSEVGIATTLIAVMTYIGTIGSLGLNFTVVRFLPRHEDKSTVLNTLFAVITITTFVISIIFLLGVNYFSPSLSFLTRSFSLSLFFSLSMIAAVWNFSLESVFIAYRRTEFKLLKNCIIAAFRQVFFFIVLSLGGVGIFGSWIAGLILAVIVSIVMLYKFFSFKLSFTISKQFLFETFHFSFVNYLVTLISLLPTIFIPIIVLNSYGSSVAAYYYMPTTIASLLFVIPLALNQSLLAEGSFEETGLLAKVKKSLFFCYALVIPSSIVLFIVGPYILGIFGGEYQTFGSRYMDVMIFSGFFLVLNYVGMSILNLKHKLTELLLINCINALSIFLFCLLFVSQGLVGMGYAWIIGQAITFVLYCTIIFFNQKTIFSMG